MSEEFWFQVMPEDILYLTTCLTDVHGSLIVLHQAVSECKFKFYT